MEIEGNQSKYEIIDFLKGFSIITIVIMHLIQSYSVPNIIYKLSSLGGTGAHVFLFCSGFGLFLSQERKKLTFVEFLRKRFLKIYVPYILVVLFASSIPYSFDGSLKERFVALLSHIFLFKMFVPELECSISYPLWYMSTLFQFYFIFLGLFKVKKKLGSKKFLYICVMLSVVWWIFTALTGICEERIWGSFFLQYLWEFGLGMCVADELNKGRTINIKKIYIFIVSIIGVIIGGIAGIKGGLFKAFNDIFMVFGYGGFAILIYYFIKPYRKLCLKVNIISFEWYLIHMTCFGIMQMMIVQSDMLKVLQAVTLFAISIVVAIIYHYNISKFNITKFNLINDNI